MINFYNHKPQELLDIILQGNEQSDNAMYYLLQDRLYNKFKEKYDMIHKKNIEDLSDILDDFFLYLREENRKTTRPYTILYTIRKKESFESWLISTFRNFLNNRVGRREYVFTYEEGTTSSDNNTFDKEELISNASILIAYSHQVLAPRNQFLLLRTLLTMLKKENALPDKEMAEAMGMSHTLYRVTTHRIMQSVRKHLQNIEAGKKPLLDDYHRSMAESINNNFDTLYSTLMKFYNTTLVNLDKASTISNLRNRYHESTGFMLHEDIAQYGSLSIYGFYNKLHSQIDQQLIA